MDLIIDNRLIDAPIVTMLERLRQETGYRYFNFIGNDSGDSIKITCPWHKDGQERHPSCIITNTNELDKIPRGWVYCFTCKKSVPFYAMVGYCLGGDDDLGKQWLVDRFGNTLLERDYILEDIVLDKKIKHNFLDESILDKYNFLHPYMFERKSTRNVISKFQIGFNKEKNTITFPMRDIKGNLVGITERSVVNKKFYIPENFDKPVYLLNYVVNENYPYCVVCESQLNALTLWTHGIPAVALIGTGTKYQYEIINKCGIRNWILCFDGDEAGRKGSYRFQQNVKDSIITNIIMPQNIDINDLSYQQVEDLFNYYNINWRIENIG